MVYSALLPDGAGGVVDPGAIATRLAASLPPTTVVVGRLPRRAAWPTGAGSPPPPHRSVHAVLPHAAHRRSSPPPIGPILDKPDGASARRRFPARLDQAQAVRRAVCDDSPTVLATADGVWPQTARVGCARGARSLDPDGHPVPWVWLTMPLGQRSDCAVFDRLREAARARRSSVVVVVRGESASVRRGSARDDRSGRRSEGSRADRRPQPATSVEVPVVDSGSRARCRWSARAGAKPAESPTRDGPPTAPTGRNTRSKA